MRPSMCALTCPCPARLQRARSDADAEALVSGYHRLTDESPGGMGGAYQVMAICHKDLAVPAGFEGQKEGEGEGAAQA